ncbi:hypothetical protein [Alkalicoccobacillus porphyridii]|uniref:Uncharacterized protein n=1 Tax=Alkalicoccobacillus porphyridii TaxID=2597270 RepID=A0A554A2J4_9BACI|nr:hypothetical protein [Alkalicoccobacillus porphyridii]TSB47910.1 hypothetical protein FN960_05230 [Alkalicoccobacillus porphyridii]
MMGKKIGNVGTLNIVSATMESINEIDRIENVGVVLHSRETAYLLPHLNIGNVGSTIEVDNNIRKATGRFIADANYLQSFENPTTVMVMGALIIDKDVSIEDIKHTECQFYVSGVVYTPEHVKGAVGSILNGYSGMIETYGQSLPRMEYGNINMTNGYLEGLHDQSALVASGKITLHEDVDLALFSKKIASIVLNGKAIISENQEKVFYEKATVNGKVEVTPTGYLKLSKSLQLTNRSIKRFKESLLYTSSPLIFDKTVSREAMQSAFASIHSTSYIICHEEIEDLVYECLNRFETDVISYTDSFRFVQKEQWEQEDAEALDEDTVVIIHTDLTLTDRVNPDLLTEKLSAIHLFGTLYVANSAQKASVQKLLATPKGKILDTSVEKKNSFGNIGELSL